MPPPLPFRRRRPPLVAEGRLTPAQAATDWGVDVRALRQQILREREAIKERLRLAGAQAIAAELDTIHAERAARRIARLDRPRDPTP